MSALLMENLSGYFHETSQKYKTSSDDVQMTRTVTTLVDVCLELFSFESYNGSFVKQLVWVIFLYVSGSWGETYVVLFFFLLKTAPVAFLSVR